MLSTGPPVWNFNFIYLIIPVRWKEVTKSCLCSPSLSPASLPINFSIRIWVIVSRQLCSDINNHLSPASNASIHADRTSIYDIWTRRVVHNSGDHISVLIPPPCISLLPTVLGTHATPPCFSHFCMSTPPPLPLHFMWLWWLLCLERWY